MFLANLDAQICRNLAFGNVCIEFQYGLLSLCLTVSMQSYMGQFQ